MMRFSWAVTIVLDSLGTMPCNNNDRSDLEEAISNSGLILKNNNKPNRTHFKIVLPIFSEPPSQYLNN
jgi:hypothetical protein